MVYLKLDALLLARVFERFQEKTLREDGLDPVHSIPLRHVLHEANERVKCLSGENEELKRSTVRAEMHIPIRNDEIVDDLLIYNEDSTERECYEDEQEKVRCHHLSINVVGEQLSVRKWRIKKRAVRRGDDSISCKRPRQ